MQPATRRMRVAIAGAGAVGRSIARKLLADGHKVLLIEKRRANYLPARVPDADWMLADCCELGALQRAGLQLCDVVVATTGDDKANLVFAFLAKTEFSVGRVVARINNPANQWLFGDAWGVDVAVSTPVRLVAAVEEAVSIGGLVELMAMQQSRGTLVEITLPPATPLAGTRLDALQLPEGTAVVAVVRARTLSAPAADLELAAGDEIMVVATAELLPALAPVFGVQPTTLGDPTVTER